MIFAKLVQKLCVHARSESWIYEGDFFAGFFANEFCCFLSDVKEITQSKDRNSFAFFANLIFELSKVLFNRIFSLVYSVARNCDNHRTFLLLKTPFKHRKIFFFACRTEICQARNICENANRRNSDVCRVSHSENRSRMKLNCHRGLVEAHILSDLIVNSLCKCRVRNKDWFSAVFGNSRAHCSCLLFGNSNIDIIITHFFADILCKSNSSRNSCRNDNDLFVFLDFFEHVVCENRIVRFSAAFVFSFACFTVKRCGPVPVFLFGFSKFVAFSLQSVDMNYCRVVNVLYFFECFDKACNIVSILNIAVIKSHRAEEICPAFSASRTEFRKIFVQAAVIFCNRLFVVIHDNDKIRLHFACIIQAFQSLAAAQRTVTDNRNDISFAAGQISPFCQACRKTYGSRSVSDVEHIVLRFNWIRKSAYITEMSVISISLSAPREHFVCIGLMGNIENKLVFW